MALTLKLPNVSSPKYLEIVRQQACVFHLLEARGSVSSNHAHHYPFRSKGVTNDLRVAPACVECHNRCHGLNVAGRSTITRSQQQIGVDFHASWFFDHASSAAWDAVGRTRDEVDAWATAALLMHGHRALYKSRFHGLDEVLLGPGGAWFVFNATNDEWQAVGAQRAARVQIVPY